MGRRWMQGLPSNVSLVGEETGGGGGVGSGWEEGKGAHLFPEVCMLYVGGKKKMCRITILQEDPTLRLNKIQEECVPFFFYPKYKFLKANC